MKRYYLDVIVGNGRIKQYQLEALGYEYSETGFYRFYVKHDENDRWTETVAFYPINRTIVKHIEKL